MAAPWDNKDYMVDPTDGTTSPYKRPRDEREPPAPREVNVPTHSLPKKSEPPDKRTNHRSPVGNLAHKMPRRENLSACACVKGPLWTSRTL
jgi:hypothetical protein